MLKSTLSRPVPQPLGAAAPTIHWVIAVESEATAAAETSRYQGAESGKYRPWDCVACRPVTSTGGPLISPPSEQAQSHSAVAETRRRATKPSRGATIS